MVALLILAQADEDDAVLTEPLESSDWLGAGAILVTSIVAAIVVSRILRRIIQHALGPGFAAILVGRFVGYAVFLIGLFYALTTLGVRVGPLLGALGLGGLVVALALQSMVENFVAALILQTGRPYTLGDTVELDGHIGIVTDIDSRTTLLVGLDKRHIRIPNANIVASTIVNLTREPIRRSTLTVGVAYGTDLQDAAETIRAALTRVERVRTTPEPTVNLREFGSSSIDFDVLYWHDSDVPSELATRHDLVIAVHQAFDAADITIAFPQLTLWTAEPSDSGPYDEYSETIRSPYPGLDRPSTEPRRRLPPVLRRPRRRRNRGDG